VVYIANLTNCGAGSIAVIYYHYIAGSILTCNLRSSFPNTAYQMKTVIFHCSVEMNFVTAAVTDRCCSCWLNALMFHQSSYIRMILKSFMNF